MVKNVLLGCLFSGIQGKKKDKEKKEEGKRETICFFQKFLTHTLNRWFPERLFLLSPPLQCNQIVPKLPLG